MTPWPGAGDIADICLFLCISILGKALMTELVSKMARRSGERLLWGEKLTTACLKMFFGEKRSWGEGTMALTPYIFPLVVALLTHGAESHMGKLIIYGFLF